MSTRLFLGWSVSKEFVKRAHLVKRRLGELEPNFRLVSNENLHLTLKFLGDVSGEQVEAVREGYQELSESRLLSSPQRIVFDVLGAFSSWKRPRVIWLGSSARCEELIEFSRKADSLFQEIGFVSEEREYKPHVTIARSRRQVKPFSVKETERVVVEPVSLPVSASSLILFESVPKGDSVIYRKFIADR